MNAGKLLLVIADVIHLLESNDLIKTDGTFGDFSNVSNDVALAVGVEHILSSYGINTPDKVDAIIKALPLLGLFVSNMPQIFSPDAITKAIQNVLDADITIPDGHKVAFVTLATLSGVHSAVAAKLNDHWKVQGEVGFDSINGGWESGITVQATW